MAMYQIWTNGKVTPTLLAIMPGDVMERVLMLWPAAMRRVERETQNNGLCAVHFSPRVQRIGFGESVLVGRFDEGRLA